MANADGLEAQNGLSILLRADLVRSIPATTNQQERWTCGEYRSPGKFHSALPRRHPSQSNSNKCIYNAFSNCHCARRAACSTQQRFVTSLPSACMQHAGMLAATSCAGAGLPHNIEISTQPKLHGYQQGVTSTDAQTASRYT